MILLLLALGCGVDADGDGFPAGEDCDDQDASAFPGGVERCDGVDNDCDALVDEHAVDALVWYEDVDGDGWGDDAAQILSCAQPAGAVDRAGDCDDHDPLRSPGREEVCASGVDEDCDGVDEACTGRWGVEALGVGSAGEAPGDRLGWSVALGDVDGDALAEEVVGAPQEEVGGPGYVWVDLSSGPVVLHGDADGDQAGRHLAAGGDVDGDGIGDLLVGAADADLGREDCGAAYLISGAELADGGLGERARAVLVGPHVEDFAGRVVDLGGDWDGDGLADVVVSGAHEHKGGQSHPGRVWLVAGQPDLSGRLDLSEVATLALEGPRAGDFLGRSVSHRGDVDGDGLDDLVVGAYGDDTAGDRAGATWLVLADAALTGRHVVDEVAAASWLGLAALDHAGRWVAAGDDTNGDGYDDVLVGAFGEEEVTGGVWLIRGGSVQESGSLDEVATAHLVGEEPHDRAGLGLDLGGDLDGDGLADLVIGAPRRSERGEEDGAVYVVFGRPGLGGTVELAEADLILGGEEAGDALGQAVVLGGDVDGDGWDELLLGAAYAQEERGSAWLVRGGPTSR